MNDFYTKSGVNVGLGDRFSKLACDVSKTTWGNSPYVRVHDFAENNFHGPRAFEFVGLGSGMCMDLGSDGVAAPKSASSLQQKLTEMSDATFWR